MRVQTRGDGPSRNGPNGSLLIASPLECMITLLCWPWIVYVELTGSVLLFVLVLFVLYRVVSSVTAVVASYYVCMMTEWLSQCMRFLRCFYIRVGWRSRHPGKYDSKLAKKIVAR